MKGVLVFLAVMPLLLLGFAILAAPWFLLPPLGAFAADVGLCLLADRIVSD